MLSPWRSVFSMWDNMWKLIEEEDMAKAAIDITALDIATAGNSGGKAYKSLRAELMRRVKKPDSQKTVEKKVKLSDRLLALANRSPKTQGAVKVVDDGSVRERYEAQQRKHGTAK